MWVRSGNSASDVNSFADLVRRIRVAEDGQAEGRLRDEGAAPHGVERKAGRVGGALVVARDDQVVSALLDLDLGGAEHVSGRMESHLHRADRAPGAEDRGLARLRESVAVAQRHDVQRLGRRHHGTMAGAGVVRMAMRDERSGRRARRVHIKIAARTIESERRQGQQIGGRHQRARPQPRHSLQISFLAVCSWPPGRGTRWSS